LGVSRHLYPVAPPPVAGLRDLTKARRPAFSETTEPKAAVVGAAISPGASPVAKAAVVGAAVSPGPSPIAKAAVVGR
jgi:hypothetical protein